MVSRLSHLLVQSLRLKNQASLSPAPSRQSGLIGWFEHRCRQSRSLCEDQKTGEFHENRRQEDERLGSCASRFHTFHSSGERNTLTFCGWRWSFSMCLPKFHVEAFWRRNIAYAVLIVTWSVWYNIFEYRESRMTGQELWNDVTWSEFRIRSTNFPSLLPMTSL